MKLNELIEKLSSLQYHDSHSVGLRIKVPYSSIGGSPFEPLIGLNVGFDWDNGRIFLTTKQDLFINLERHNKAARAMGEIYGWLKSNDAKVDKLKVIENVVNHYIKKVGPSGGMADALGLGPSTERCAGSSPVSDTKEKQMSKPQTYTVKIEENGVIPIPEPLMKECPWIKTHEIHVIKVTEADGTWKLVMKPGKKKPVKKKKIKAKK